MPQLRPPAWRWRAWDFHGWRDQSADRLEISIPLTVQTFIFSYLNLPPSHWPSTNSSLHPVTRPSASHCCPTSADFCPPHTFTCPLFCVRLSSVCSHVSVFCMFRGSVSNDNLLGSEVHYCLAATRKKSELPRLRPTTFRAQVPNWHIPTWWQSFHFFFLSLLE